jgi:hypothetical protein
MEKLQEFTDAELELELNRRRVEAKRLELERKKSVFRTLIQHRAILLELIPHARGSCSDKFVSNGFGSADYGARCSRCALLELVETDALEYDVKISLEFSKSPV